MRPWPGSQVAAGVRGWADGAAEGAAAVDHLVGGGPQAAQPVLVDDGLHQQVPVGEVELPLGLREHPGLVGENLVRLHCAPS